MSVPSNLRNLRPRPQGPYDHAAEDAIPVALTPITWSLVERLLRVSGSTAAVEVADEIRAQVRPEAMRMLEERAAIGDARHDYEFDPDYQSRRRGVR